MNRRGRPFLDPDDHPGYEQDENKQYFGPVGKRAKSQYTWDRPRKVCFWAKRSQAANPNYEQNYQSLNQRHQVAHDGGQPFAALRRKRRLVRTEDDHDNNGGASNLAILAEEVAKETLGENDDVFDGIDDDDAINNINWDDVAFNNIDALHEEFDKAKEQQDPPYKAKEQQDVVAENFNLLLNPKTGFQTVQKARATLNEHFNTPRSRRMVEMLYAMRYDLAKGRPKGRLIFHEEDKHISFDEENNAVLDDNSTDMLAAYYVFFHKIPLVFSTRFPLDDGDKLIPITKITQNDIIRQAAILKKNFQSEEDGDGDNDGGGDGNNDGGGDQEKGLVGQIVAEAEKIKVHPEVEQLLEEMSAQVVHQAAAPAQNGRKYKSRRLVADEPRQFTTKPPLMNRVDEQRYLKKHNTQSAKRKRRPLL